MRCALRNGLRPSTRTSYFISSSARTRSASGPLARHATSTASRATRRSARTPSMPSPPNSPLIAFRATPRARSACTAQRETDHEEGASEDCGTHRRGRWDRRSVKWAGTRSVAKCEARADAPTPRRPRHAKRCEARRPCSPTQPVPKYEVRADASPRPAPTHAVRNAWTRGSTEHEEITRQSVHDQRCAQRTADATGAKREPHPVNARVAHRGPRPDGAQDAYRGAATSGRDGRATRAQRTDTATTTTTDTTKGRSPGRERTDRTGQRAPRTDERQRGQPPERVGRGGKSERPLVKATRLCSGRRCSSHPCGGLTRG